MTNRGKENVFLVGLTILHLIAVLFVLGRMPFINFYHFQTHDAMAIGVWTAYAAALYIVIAVCEKGISISPKVVMKAIGFGIFMSLGKGCVGTIGDRIGVPITNEARYIVIESQIETLLFGFVLFGILHMKVFKKKLSFKFKPIKRPVLLILLVTFIYVLQVAGSLRVYAETLAQFSFTEVQIYRLDIYIASKILNYNTWSYAVLYVLFWQLWQNLTEE
ncbi:MAG: hypothetical protein HDQ99_07885 [Lachnospiraceae bacterium]|nr:hypothetical protein [Lachnospiraceae bacterium]